MAMVGGAELREGVEKVVVAGYTWRRNETAHREGIDQCVEKMLAILSIGTVRRNIDGALALIGVGRWDFSVSATCWRRGAVGCDFRSDKRKGSEVHAEMIFRGGTDPRLRVDGAAQVIVQIGAFRHFLEQVAELQGIRSRGFEIELRAPLERRLGIG